MMVASVAMRTIILATLASTFQPSLASRSLGSSVMETIAAFDRNSNGKVDKSEIEVVARRQGLAVEEVLGDFADIDTNEDGELDAAELTRILGPAKDQPKALGDTFDASVVLPSSPPTGQFEHNRNENRPALTLAKVSGNVQHKLEGEKLDMLLDAKSMEDDAQKLAGEELARDFTKRAKQLLMQSKTDDKSAEYFETLARSLRGSVQTLLKRSDADVRHTASEATGKRVQDTLPVIQKLHLEGSQISQKADEHRTLAHQAMKRVVKAQSTMTQLLKLN